MCYTGRWLCNDSLPSTSRRWAVEGLAYLTFDADVKEDLVEDTNALQAMFQLAKVNVKLAKQYTNVIPVLRKMALNS